MTITPDTNTQNSYEAPGFTLGASNVEGSGNSVRSGATILAFDATDPSTQDHGDSAAVGSAVVAARRDHKHAMPAAAGGSAISARVYHSANQRVAFAAEVTLAFNSERFDTDTIHDNSTNNSRLTCKTAGKYYIFAEGKFYDHGTGTRDNNIKLNGTTQIAKVRVANTGEDAKMNISCLYDLAVND